MLCQTHVWLKGLVLAVAFLQCTPAHASIIYVDDDADPNGDGLIWSTAYDDLQVALSTAQSDPNITEIHVAGGTYVPSDQTDPKRSPYGDVSTA